MESQTATVGYIGLGQMGSAMVRRLRVTGVDVVVFDLDEGAMSAAEALGARRVANPAEVAAAAEVVSICVPAAHHVTEVLTGTGGIADAGRGDQTILVHSTIAPNSVVTAHDTAREWGAWLHDACVAGGAEAAASGELVVLAGGLDHLSQPARHLLDVYGSLVVDAGGIGAGAALKLAVNTMTYAQFAAAATAFELIRQAGADTAALVETWRHTGQLGRLTESFLPLLDIGSEHITGAFGESLANTASIATKDLDLALDALGADTDVLGAIVAAMSVAMPTVFGVDHLVDDPGGSTDE